MGNENKNQQCPKQCWVNIELRDESNSRVGGVQATVTYTNRSGKVVTVIMFGSHISVPDICCKPVKITFNRSKLWEKACTLPINEGSSKVEPAVAKEYVDKPSKYHLVAYTESDHKHASPKRGPLVKELAPNTNHVIEIQGIGEEHVAVVGTENYDIKPGNKLSFPAQAVRMVRNVALLEKRNKKTILMFTASYTSAQIAEIKKSAQKFDAAFIQLLSVNDYFAYINTGNSTVLRKRYLIKRVDFYSHGVPGVIAFGFNMDESLNMTDSNFTTMNKTSFTSKATVQSYACRTGMSKNFDEKNKDPKPEASLAQQIANHLEVPVYAYIRRSNYGETWSTSMLDSAYIATGVFNDLQQERDKYMSGIGALYESNGARGGVITGDTPSWAPRGFKKFMPK